MYGPLPIPGGWESVTGWGEWWAAGALRCWIPMFVSCHEVRLLTLYPWQEPCYGSTLMKAKCVFLSGIIPSGCIRVRGQAQAVPLPLCLLCNCVCTQLDQSEKRATVLKQRINNGRFYCVVLRLQATTFHTITEIKQ